MNCELPDVQAGFRKGRGTRDQIANTCWIIGKQGNLRKTSTSALLGASLVAQMVKHLLATWETLGQKDSLEKEIATHSSTLAWKIPWTEEPGRLQSMGSQRVGHD